MSDVLSSSNKSLIKRTAEVIAIEINSIKDQTKKILLASSIEIGRRLVEAKELVPHGEWEAWLEKSVDYSKSTAKNLMRIFQEYGADQISLFGDNVKSQAFGDLNYSQAVALLGIPADEREKFIEENDMENMSTRELQKAIKEREQALKEKKEAEEAFVAINKTLESMKNVNEQLKSEKEKEKTARLKAEKQALDLRGQIKNNAKQLDDYKAQLEEAQRAGNIEEVEALTSKIDFLDLEVEKLRVEKEELEKQLKEKPIDVITAEPQVIERIPGEVVQELQELRAKVNQPANSDTAVLKFSFQFDGLVRGFKDMLGTLEEIQSSEVKEKYKTAVKGLITKMAERV